MIKDESFMVFLLNVILGKNFVSGLESSEIAEK